MLSFAEEIRWTVIIRNKQRYISSSVQSEYKKIQKVKTWREVSANTERENNQVVYMQVCFAQPGNLYDACGVL